MDTTFFNERTVGYGWLFGFGWLVGGWWVIRSLVSWGQTLNGVRSSDLVPEQYNNMIERPVPRGVADSRCITELIHPG